jgi:hypothetical protein
VKFTVRLPVMLLRFTTLGLNVHPALVGMTETEAVFPGVLIGNENVPVNPVVAVACCCPLRATLTPESGRPTESVMTPEMVAESALVTDSVESGGRALVSLHPAAAATATTMSPTAPTPSFRLLARMGPSSRGRIEPHF